MDASSQLRKLDYVTNSIYTKIVDEDMKPNLAFIYDFMLKNIGYDKEIWYGDMDVYISIEKSGNESQDVIIIRDVVTCSDKNIVVALINVESKFISTCKNVYSIGVKNNYNFNDFRDWDKEGLDTLRNHHWDFGYSDLKSNTLVFHASSMSMKINNSLYKRHYYNGWDEHSYGSGFHPSNFLFAQRVIATTKRVLEERTYSEK